MLLRSAQKWFMMGKIDVVVAYAKPEKQVELFIQVEANCTVALAIRRSGILKQFPEIDFPNIEVGIFSKKVALDASLKNGDRIEIYRPLVIDPKQSRRLRSKQ
jgi:uncharacterized protein